MTDDLAIIETRRQIERRRDLRVRAEALWEELGGDLCICQRLDVPHWCERCQRRIDLIEASLCRAIEIAANFRADEMAKRLDERTHGGGR